MTTRKLPDSWAYDFTLDGYGRQRKGGFLTKAEAVLAEKSKREALLSGARKILFADAYQQYMDAKKRKMKDRTRDSFEFYWKERIRSVLGHLYIEDVDTITLDKFKQGLPEHIGPNSINKHLALIRAVLRFMWRRQAIKFVPMVPTEPVPKAVIEWYSEQERDRFLDGMFHLRPDWYAFFYISMRLGLRLGEVYAIRHSRLRDIPPQLTVDRTVQRGTKTRPALLKTRKNDEEYALDLPDDVMQVIRWHIREGYAGSNFLFSKTGEFPIFVDSHRKPMAAVQKAVGLRQLSHHKIGRHSVGGQAITSGETTKALQAQLGHRSAESTRKYEHIGSKVQLRLVERLAPASPAHGNLTATAQKTAETTKVVG